MHLLSNALRSTALATLSLSLVAGVALASDNKIAVAPGGPHPYFAPWEQAAADAKKDFGIADVDYKVPTDWKLELQTELLREPGLSGLQGLRHLPRRPGRRELDHHRAQGRGHSGRCARRLHRRSDRRRILLCDRPLQDHLHQTKALIKAMGGKGNIVHLTGLLIDTNTTLREQAVQKAVDETGGAVKLVADGGRH